MFNSRSYEEQVEQKLEELRTVDPALAELFELALAFRETEEELVQSMFVRRFTNVVDEVVPTLRMLLATEQDESDEDDDCCGCCECDESYSLDEVEELCDVQEEEEEEEEPETDELAEALGLESLDGANTLQVASNIVRAAGGDESKKHHLINLATERGYNRAHLTTMVEDF